MGDGQTIEGQTIEGHGGTLAVAVAQAHGVRAMFTLSGAHVFPLYDGAVKAKTPMPLIDVRHEQTAVFAAEATAKLTRTPGLAVLTAGPGVTNGVSAVTSAHFNGVPVVVLGGRAPAFRWGSGALQELDHPPILAPVTKSSGTVREVADTVPMVSEAFRLATEPHRGPVFLDVPMDQLYSRTESAAPVVAERPRSAPDPDDVHEIAALLGDAKHPVLVLGSDVWTDGAEDAATRLVETLRIPVVANGMGRGILPPTHPCLVTRARGVAFGQADLVLVVGTPLDFRLGYGVFGGKPNDGQSGGKPNDGQSGGKPNDGQSGGKPNDGRPARVVHIADSREQLATHTALAASACGDLTLVLDGLTAAFGQLLRSPSYDAWTDGLRADANAAIEADQSLLRNESDPIHPARIYGELIPRLADDSVVIGDGGDFVSFAGRFVEPSRPGGWLDPGPYGCLGTGLGYAIAARLARPSAQVVLMLGDGAAGFSLMDVDTLVRHELPVVMVVGNNGMWGLEKGPMQFLYGYDVAADLRPDTRYDEVVSALGGAGESVSSPAEVGPALDRAFAAGVPYLVNVRTDPTVAYPRTTTGV